MNQGPKKNKGHTGRDSKFVVDIRIRSIPRGKLSDNAVSSQRDAITPGVLSCQKLTETIFFFKYFCKKKEGNRIS